METQLPAFIEKELQVFSADHFDVVAGRTVSTLLFFRWVLRSIRTNGGSVMWMRIATSLMFSLLAFACNAAPWEVVKQVDAMTDEVRVSAMTTNEDGASLSVYKVRDGSVWANFTLPRSSTDVLASNRYPLYRVDKRAPRDLDRERTLPRLIRDYTPAAVREPKWINFRLWTGSTPARSEELIEMMEGSTAVFRYYLFTGGYKETSFTLNGLVVGEVLGLRESQTMRSAEEMVRMMGTARKACENNAVRVDFSVCFERAKACSVQASGDPAAFLACNTP